MPHISSKELKEKDERILKARLVDMLRVIGKNRKASHSLRELLSDTEMIMLSKRLGIIYLISKEKPTLDICEMLQVSSSTVIRMEKKFDRGGYINLERVLKKLEPSIIDMLETILGAGLPPIAGRGRWKFLDDF
ncbi:MAG: hypothetical protein G01um101424_238 [Parcubacteria group bacterium Gr01-1014_24]|nr:MAG: hypothetical protein G01um101424_238 [Parcubacteria group bacterium Gr01-1014_24]